MSKRTERRAAERESRKLAYQQLRQAQTQQPEAQPSPLIADHLTGAPENTDVTDLLARAQAFFDAKSTTAAEPEAKPEPQTTSAAQIAANRENAKFSSGPVTRQGKATVSQNRRSHGLAGRFTVLAWENAADFQALAESVHAEHNPETGVEQRLVDSYIQHYWLTQRAVRMQEDLIARSGDPTEVDAKKLSLFLRYQTTHERSYYKAERELQNLKKAKRKDEIGFESQKQRQESHEARVRLTHARACNLEIDTAARQVMEAPLPGNTRIPFEELTKACSIAIATVVYENQCKTASQNG
jgi:hypothetical protein